MLQRIHYLLALEAILLLTLAAFAGDAAADIHLKDTYYVVSLWQAFSALALAAGVLFLSHFAALKWLRVRSLSLVHVIGTLVLFSVIEIVLYRSVYRSDLLPTRADFSSIVTNSEWILRLMYAFLVWQVLLPFNLLMSMWPRTRRGID